MEKPAISVIISTYNAPKWLTKTLVGYGCQSIKNFELVIADDGSTESTKSVINSFRNKFQFPIQHIWHEDDGFQKSKILNKAILACKSDYILMSDGDCIPRKDFLEVHLNKRQPNHFLSGGYYKLPMSTSQKITKEDIENQLCFDLDWLKENGVKKSYKNIKFKVSGATEVLLNRFTPTKSTWNGHNASGWKQDIMEVNGMDERMQYGGQDRELGERLMNKGINGIQIRYSAVCIHLDHARGYAKKESIEKNLAIRKHTKETKSTWTKFGIVKGQD